MTREAMVEHISAGLRAIHHGPARWGFAAWCLSYEIGRSALGNLFVDLVHADGRREEVARCRTEREAAEFVTRGMA